MTNRAKIYEVNEVNEGIMIFQARVFKLGNLIGNLKLVTNAKFQLSIFKIMLSHKNTGT